MSDPFDILTDELEKDIEASLSEAFAQVANAIDIEALTVAIQSDDDAAIAAALNLDEGLQTHLDHVLANGLFYVLLSGIVIAMQRFAKRHGSFVHPDGEVAQLTREIRRNVVEPLARRAYESALVTIQILRAAGFNARTIAQETTRALSLTPDQAKSVAYFHRALEEALNSPHATHHSGGATIPRLTAKKITRRHAGHLNAAQRSILTKTLAGDLTENGIAHLTARHSRALSDFRRSAIARQEAVSLKAARDVRSSNKSINCTTVVRRRSDDRIAKLCLNDPFQPNPSIIPLNEENLGGVAASPMGERDRLRGAEGGPSHHQIEKTMTQAQAELIDIDFLCYLIDESYEDHWEGDIVTFIHPRRGKLTAIQSGRVAMLTSGDIKDNRGLPATAEVINFISE